MKIITFPRLMKWCFLSGFTLLVALTLARIMFFYSFKTGQYTLQNSFSSFWLGVRFDIRVICAIILLPYMAGNCKIRYLPNNRMKSRSILQIAVAILFMLLAIFFLFKSGSFIGIGILLLVFGLFFFWLYKTRNCNPFQNEISEKVFKIYFLIISFCLFLVYAVDFLHFEYLRHRLNASVLNYFGDAQVTLGMITQTYPVFTLLLIIIGGTLLLWGIIILWYRILEQAQFDGHDIFRIVFGYMVIFGMLFGIFGRFNQYPLRWSDAFIFEDDFKINLALNPVQSFLSSFRFRHSTYDINQVKEHYTIIAAHLGVKEKDSLALQFNRPFFPDITVNEQNTNVVVVICESFSAYKSSMYGNYLNTTPYFNKMCSEGIFFDRCFTPSYGTARGVWAIVTGIPDVEYPNTSSRNPEYVDQHTIINDYKGYNKLYFLGGSSSWANIRGLLTKNISGLQLYEEEKFSAKTVDVWGISDKRLFLEANKVFTAQAQPFFAVIQTADNHRPYTIPVEDTLEFHLQKYSSDSLKMAGFQSNEELNAFRYMDFCFMQFIEAAKKESYFTNTIFVFVGDHGIQGDPGNMFPDAWTANGLTAEHIPLLFYAPGKFAAKRIPHTCSQLDVLPSVTALAQIPYTNTTMGKNLFGKNSDSAVNSAFLYDYNTRDIGMITDKYVFIHNLVTGNEDFRSSQNNNRIGDHPEVLQEKEYLKSLSLGFYETAKYLLKNNRFKPEVISPGK